MVSELAIFAEKLSKITPPKKVIIGSLQTILLCIVGELAGGGFAVVAVNVGSKWRVTDDTWHMKHDTYNYGILNGTKYDIQ